MLKLHHRNLSNMFLALFQRNEQVHTFSIRNSKSLHYPHFSKTVTQQSIMCRGVKIWNSIPFTVRNKQSQSAFKKNLKGSGYFASRGKIAPCYFAIWRQNSPSGYFAASAKIALTLILTQTLTLTQTLSLILTLIPTLTLTLTQTEEKHYFVSRGKIGSHFQNVI